MKQLVFLVVKVQKKAKRLHARKATETKRTKTRNSGSTKSTK